MPDSPPLKTPPLPMAHLTGPRPALDPRTHLARPDLVEISLAASVAAARYTAPQPMACALPRAAMRANASPDATAVSEVLHGEAFDLYDLSPCGGWAFGRTLHDQYLGWVPAHALTDRTPAPTHRITARSAPVFTAADIKSPVLALLPMGSHIHASPQGRLLALASGGHVHAAHTSPLPHTGPLAPRLLGIARRFLGAPYVWGGRSPHGVDCSGLVQASLSFCDIAAPRDSDQQRDTLGHPVAMADRTAGDLVFFPGHVGILAPDDLLLHANAHWMATVEEPLQDVLARQNAAEPLAIRRL